MYGVPAHASHVRPFCYTVKSFVELAHSGHASVQTSGFSLTLRNRGKGGWARDLRGRRQNCLPRYSAGVKSRSVVLGYPS